MPTIQELADIAAGHDTAMADAMIAACVVRHYRTGEPLSASGALLARLRGGPRRQRGPVAVVVGGAPEWERMVRGNRDTRWNHC